MEWWRGRERGSAWVAVRAARGGAGGSWRRVRQKRLRRPHGVSVEMREEQGGRSPATAQRLCTRAATRGSDAWQQLAERAWQRLRLREKLSTRAPPFVALLVAAARRSAAHAASKRHCSDAGAPGARAALLRQRQRLAPCSTGCAALRCRAQPPRRPLRRAAAHARGTARAAPPRLGAARRGVRRAARCRRRRCCGALLALRPLLARARRRRHGRHRARRGGRAAG